MSGNFSQAYATLTDFIAQHPEIEIGDSVTSIPETVRAEFYGFFNAARDAFLEERFPESIGKMDALLDKFREAEANVKDLLSWEDTQVVTRLQRFLSDPKDCLTRELFDPLFDLLKGRESMESFEARASHAIKTVFPTVFREGYEKWAVLSLAKLLEARKAFRVNVRTLNAGERSKVAAYAPLEDVPAPDESAAFFLSQPRDVIFAVPDFILHSSRLNRFVGIRSQFREGLYNACNCCEEREWYPLNTDLMVLMESGLTLVYDADCAENIALVADVAKFCRPDLVLWCIDTADLTQKEAMETMMQIDRFIKPQKGSYLVSMNPWPECQDPAEAEAPTPATEQTANLHFLTVGFDAVKLNPIVEALDVVKG